MLSLATLCVWLWGWAGSGFSSTVIVAVTGVAALPQMPRMSGEGAGVQKTTEWVAEVSRASPT